MELFSEETRRDPYPLYARLREEMPVLRLEAQRAWVVFRYEDVKRALQDAESFSSDVSTVRGEKMEWLLFMDPPRHTELRAIVNRAFTSRSVAALEPRIREISAGLLRGREELDVVGEYAARLPMMVIAEMLGLPVEDHARYTRWSEAIVGLGNTISGDDAAEASRAFQIAEAEMTDMVLRHARTQFGDTLLARLAAAGLDEKSIVRFVQLLIAAGSETTTNTISNAMLCGATVDGIEEVLRYRSPVQAMFRVTTKAVEIAGVTIPERQFVIASIGAANRDPRVFAEPERFDARRATNLHLAFGHGAHFCLGAPLARLEARIALEDLATFRATSTTGWLPRASFHVHGPQALRVRRVSEPRR